MNLVDKLLAVTPADNALTVARLIADKLIYFNRTDEYRFRANHDISPPKCLPCPMGPYDWSIRGYVGLETPSRARAKQWLTDAAYAGYTIEEVDRHRKPTGNVPESIERVRSRAAWHQRPKGDPDDDIPF